MPDVDALEKTNGHHEEPDVSSPLDDTLSPHPLSTSGAAAESTEDTAALAKHAEGETKDEPPAEKPPSKTTATKHPATAKKARVPSPSFVRGLQISSS